MSPKALLTMAFLKLSVMMGSLLDYKVSDGMNDRRATL
jgi:hypothetical protein